MLSKIQQLLNFIGQKGMRDEYVCLCGLQKLAQTQQMLFPHPITAKRESVFHAGRTESGAFRCAGCGDLFAEDDIHGFYKEEQMEDSDLEDAPIYTEEFPQTEYNPELFLSNYKTEIPKLLTDFYSIMRRFTQAISSLPPQKLEFTIEISPLNFTWDEDNRRWHRRAPPNTTSAHQAVWNESPQDGRARSLTLEVDDVFEPMLSDLYTMSRWSSWHYQRLYEKGVKVYIDGKLITPEAEAQYGKDFLIPTLEPTDWKSISDNSKLKIEKLYKAHLGKGSGLDDIRAELEQISDKIKDYKSVLPNYIMAIIKSQEIEGEEAEMGGVQAVSWQRRRMINDAVAKLSGPPRHASGIFGRFLFPESGSGLSGSDYVDSLIKTRMDQGSEYTMSLQSALDEAEQIMNMINNTDRSNLNLGTSTAPVGSTKLQPIAQIVKYPICEDCSSDLLSECADCNEEYLKEDLEYINTDDEPICEGCRESYTNCDNCDVLIYTESYYENAYHTTEDGEIFCNDCYNEVLGVDADTMLEHLTDALSQGVIGLNTPHGSGGQTQTSLIPISSVLLKKAIQVLQRLRHGDIVSLTGSRFRSEEARAAVLEKLKGQLQSQGLSSEDSAILALEAKRFLAKHLGISREIMEDEAKININKFIEKLQRQIASTNSFYDNYPLSRRLPDGNVEAVKRELESGKKKRLEAIRGFHPIPVDYKVTESRYNDIPSFTIVMSPSDRMLEMSKSIFGTKGLDAWNLLSKRGTQHHRGAIAYARISKVEDESLVINNFQRDSDIYNLGKELLKGYKESDPELYNAIRWWDKKVKYWHIQFLLTLTEFAKKQSEALFFTPFEVQKRKWSTVPERNRDVYDKVPEEMMTANRAGLQEFYADREEEEREDIIADELFPRMEYYEGSVERVSSGYDLWRLAEDFERKRLLYKIASHVL